jgi:hypothetical protein
LENLDLKEGEVALIVSEAGTRLVLVPGTDIEKDLTTDTLTWVAYLRFALHNNAFRAKFFRSVQAAALFSAVRGGDIEPESILSVFEASKSEEWMRTMALLFLQSCDEELVDMLMDMESKMAESEGMANTAMSILDRDTVRDIVQKGGNAQDIIAEMTAALSGATEEGSTADEDVTVH